MDPIALVFGPAGSPLSGITVAAYVFRDNLRYAQRREWRNVAAANDDAPCREAAA